MPKQRQLTRHKQPPKQSIPAITLLLDSSFRHITFTINRTSTLKAPSVWLITVWLLMINKERKIKYVRVCECLCKYGLCYHISCKFAVKKKALKRRSADGKWLTHSERLDEVDERVTAVAARASSQQPLSKAETLWVKEDTATRRLSQIMSSQSMCSLFPGEQCLQSILWCEPHLKRARLWVLEVAWVWGGSAERLGPRSQIRLCGWERRSVEETRGSSDSSQPGAPWLSSVLSFPSRGSSPPLLYERSSGTQTTELLHWLLAELETSRGQSERSNVIHVHCFTIY